MTAAHQTRRVYSAEELHRLRGACSQPNLCEAIEERDGVDAELVKGFEYHRKWVDDLVADLPSPTTPQAKLLLTAHDCGTEHVLRGSKSFAARSWKSRASGNSLRVPSNKENRSAGASDNGTPAQHIPTPVPACVLGEIAPNNQGFRPGPFRFRRSPTPSLKRKKVEAIVKAHGSPTHVRVTAGGRIVPSEQSPLCHPRYGYSAIKTNGGLIKFAPNHPMGKSQWTRATQNGFVAQDVNGRLCQIVDGTILPLTEYDGEFQLFMPAPNLNITQRGSSLGATNGRFGQNGTQQHIVTACKPTGPPEPPIAAQVNALELEYSKLDHELKDVDKTEVLHGRTMGKAAKEALIGKRRELVIALDNVRKALKCLKEQPPVNDAAAPCILQNNHSTSPPRNRLPAFLQSKQLNSEPQMPPVPPQEYGPYYNHGHRPTFAGSYGFQTTPSPDLTFDQPWAIGPPAAMFITPPFDGSMSATSLPYLEPYRLTAPSEQLSPPEISSAQDAKHIDCLPQSDGTRSFADLQTLPSHLKSRALPIKAPEGKGVTNIKSNLNPMSPAYKPGVGMMRDGITSSKDVKDRIPTPLALLPPAQPGSSGPMEVLNTTDDSVSPTKKSLHLHSSSISSFETADFFPRNTREYSTRKHAYPSKADEIENKEEACARPCELTQNSSPFSSHLEKADLNVSENAHKATAPRSRGANTPSAPPGTPINYNASSAKESLRITTNGQNLERPSSDIEVDAVPDREEHNISPKAKRQDWLFIQEHPSREPSHHSSSPEKLHVCQELCVTSSPYNSLDITKKSYEWIEGYQAGLNRKAISADRMGDFLDGYCSGLLKSKSAVVGPSTGSPVKPASRRPSPVPLQPSPASGFQPDYRAGNLAPAPFETQFRSMDTLKQAVFAPQNENAVLTPAPDGLHVSETGSNLGAWGKDQERSGTIDGSRAGYGFPKRTFSMIQRQVNPSEDCIVPKSESLETNRGRDQASPSAVALLQERAASNQLPPLPSSPTMSAKNAANTGAVTASNRITSVASMDSNLYRSYPGYRVISPHLEWKSASSVAQHAGLAAGFFANAQFDGTHATAPASCPTELTDVHRPGALQPPQSASIANNPVMRQRSHFKENSLDGITNPPLSPPPMSPPMSPEISPSKGKNPGKGGSSPARAKFEHIAEKVGIKAAPGSPPSKRRWRDVWRGSKKEAINEDNP